MKNALFVGLTTLDFVYLVDAVPHANQKLVALEQAIAAGGPATNAAVAFQYLGGQANLLSVIGSHELVSLIQADLEPQGIKQLDLKPENSEPPPVSTILVTKQTGDRAVVSRNAVKHQGNPDKLQLAQFNDCDGILIDGHQMAVSFASAKAAQGRGIPIVIDGGSWKPGFETVLPFATAVIASANFRPPGCKNSIDALDYLENLGIPYLAVTQGAKDILVCDRGSKSQMPVTPIQARDTLGAGDFFHGAFCYHFDGANFEYALSAAAAIASFSCQFFGTRQWLTEKFK
ncbi:MAG: PfkB family carbohydrate kinase [Cyanobacteria bacterium P01_H01_bin.15]